MTTKMLCGSDWRVCRWRGKESELLRAPSPFDATIEITACPNCKEIGGCMQACETHDCWHEATVELITPECKKRICTACYREIHPYSEIN